MKTPMMRVFGKTRRMLQKTPMMRAFGVVQRILSQQTQEIPTTKMPGENLIQRTLMKMIYLRTIHMTNPFGEMPMKPIKMMIQTIIQTGMKPLMNHPILGKTAQTTKTIVTIGTMTP